MWTWIDNLSHALNRWHLMPRRLGRWICDRMDLSLGMTREELANSGRAGDFVDEVDISSEPVGFGDFYEEDEPPETIVTAFGTSRRRGTTATRNSVYRTYACAHGTISGPLTGPPTVPCGCEMQQV